MKEINMLTKLIALKAAYVNNEDGATAIEYGLIAAGIAVAIAAAVTLVGTDLNTLLGQVSAAL